VRREALSHPLAIAGVLLTTASAVLFLALVIAMLAELFHNPYAGLVVFVAIPAAFVVGLILIPTGVALRQRRLARDPTEEAGWPVLDFRRASVRRTALLAAALTAVNVVIVLLAGYGTLHWMESPNFCGQACHAPMHPQFTAWQNGPHARIACVACHIGEGPRAFIQAKLSGVRQLVHVATSSYPQPIPPGTELPPGAQAETCRGCHQPERIQGDRIHVIREYADDEANTESRTILQLHVGRASSSGRAIHWHADPAIRIEYVATGEARQTIPYVKVTGPDRTVKEYVSAEANEKTIAGGQRRTMDCMDCHNTVGHPISQTPERAVDDAIASGRVSRQLRHARREAVRLMTAHAAAGDGGAAIERDLRTFSEPSRSSTDQQALARAASALQDVYRRNVFPAMKVTWGSYPDNKGHVTSNGCFRCHDGSHTASDGSTINADCEYCHKQIE
jgi:hypothetical protein